MTMSIAIVLTVVGLACGVAAGWWLARRRTTDPASVVPGDHVRRILLPFTGTSISRRAFDAAMRLARAEGATIMPCYLATVPLNLPLDAPLPKQCSLAMPLLEVIEQRAGRQGVPVDARVARGRTYRDALRHALEEEPVDRVIVSATATARMGFSGDDLVWLLRRADAEVLILRPSPEDHRTVSAADPSLAGHF
jgi:nucleotide-binding universal stress UspA family protein